jgi:hypothetical protein
MIHLYDLAEFPNTLCGLNRAWGAPYAVVYAADLDKVNCADCLARVKPRPVRVQTIKPHELDLAHIVAWVVLSSIVILIALVALP